MGLVDSGCACVIVWVLRQNFLTLLSSSQYWDKFQNGKFFFLIICMLCVFVDILCVETSFHNLHLTNIKDKAVILHQGHDFYFNS